MEELHHRKKSWIFLLPLSTMFILKARIYYKQRKFVPVLTHIHWATIHTFPRVTIPQKLKEICIQTKRKAWRKKHETVKLPNPRTTQETPILSSTDVNQQWFHLLDLSVSTTVEFSLICWVINLILEILHEKTQNTNAAPPLNRTQSGHKTQPLDKKKSTEQNRLFEKND